MNLSNPLDQFLPATRAWFEETLGVPTPPQAQGWPAIQRGDHTLILAPTGSGKTLTAFLWGIDRLFRVVQAQAEEATNAEATPAETGTSRKKKASVAAQTQLLYISPLKALNNDIERNLRVPLAGIRRVAREQGADLPELTVAVRSGDTSSRERQAMVRKPPHILITTPESLYIMLTSPKARDLFRTVQTVIVDEIHTLAGSKRGVHLAITLERLQALADASIQRIGLSATIQPLDEVARYLGGAAWQGAGMDRHLVPRPVAIVDGGYRKPLDLRVETVVEDFRNLPGDSIWPSLIPRVTELIAAHKTTLIFTNNRRQAERTADRINEQRAAEARGETTGLLVDGLAKGAGMFGAGTGTVDNPIRAHHGSMSKEVRLALETDLKAGKLPALVGTSSLELGIDIGAVDLVVQIESPKAVAQGLQRVGRAGHLVGQTSKGRIFPTHRENVMEAAAVAGGMLRGEVEPIHTPRNALDVLAQQIVALVSVEEWRVEALYDLIRQAYPYAELTPRVFQATLAMLAGHFPSVAHRQLRPRLVWDRVNNKLAALPGARLQALTSGGTITDRGAFNAYLSDGKTKLGELDEEFVYETRVGDTLILGSQVWRVSDLTDDKVMLIPAPGATPRMPFWRGDFPWRPYELGERVGAFRRTVAERLTVVKSALGLADYRAIMGYRHPTPALTASEEGAIAAPDVEFGQATTGSSPAVGGGRERSGVAISPPPSLPQRRGGIDVSLTGTRLPPQPGEGWGGVGQEGVADLLTWLATDYALDANSAWSVIDYVAGQLDHTGVISSDHTILVELFEDALGEPRMVIQSPFGGKVNGLWGLALASALRERTGVEVELQSNDDGILFRFPDADSEFPLDLVTDLTPDEARERILLELPNSAVFGAQFRQNAARALLLPGAGKGKRTPFWLQRLRAKDLLQVVRNLQDFPIVAETYRDCLEEVMDLPHLLQVLKAIQQGQIRIEVIESLTPSPVAQSLLWDLIAVYMYEWDAPKAERQLQTLAVNRDLLQDLLQDIDLADLLRPEAVAAISDRLQHTAPMSQARSAEELAAFLQEFGDLSSSEIAQRTTVDPAGWIGQLAGAQRILQLPIPTSHGPQERWIDATLLPEYTLAFGLTATQPVSTGFGLSATDFNRLRAPDAKVGPTVDDAATARCAILQRYLRQTGPITEAAILARYAFPPEWLRVELARLVAERQLAHGRFTPNTSATDEYVDRHTLEQMHRRTLTLLRKEVQPVSYAAYADFLARWQHLHSDTRLRGEGALRQLLQQLRGLPVVGRLWERDLLPSRIVDYDSRELATLCQAGELVWVGSGGVDPRRSRIRWLFRGEGSSYLEAPPAELTIFSTDAQQLYAFLQSEGAVFQHDIRAALEWTAATTDAALLELAMAGLVTNDSLHALHRLIGGEGARAATTPAKIQSTLEAQLAERLGDRAGRGGGAGWSGGRRPSQSELQAAKRRVRQRLERTEEAFVATPQEGRWALVHRFGVMGKAPTPAEQVAQQARQLLARWGVITHETLANEQGAWDWGLLYPEFQRLEMRGEVRRGYFVEGLPGIQFALPAVVERLREDHADDETLLLLNATDPANLYGPALPHGPLRFDGAPMAFTRIPSTWLVQQRGLLVLLIEGNGTQITTGQGVDDVIARQGVQRWLDHVTTFERRITIEQWNGEKVIGTAGQRLLEALSFYREYPAMVWTR